MAEVNLKHIEKVYPHAGGKKPAPKKHDGEKKGPNLKVTDEGVVASRISTSISPITSSLCSWVLGVRQVDDAAHGGRP